MTSGCSFGSSEKGTACAELDKSATEAARVPIRPAMQRRIFEVYRVRTEVKSIELGEDAEVIACMSAEKRNWWLLWVYVSCEQVEERYSQLFELVRSGKRS